MTLNVEIERQGTENSASVMRKFSRRMIGTGIVRHMRGKRYFTRQLSTFGKKKKALRKIARREQFETLIKEGKLSDQIRGKRVKWGK